MIMPMTASVQYCSVRTHVSGFDGLLESTFCILLIVEVFPLHNVEILEDVWVVSSKEVR